MASSSWRLLDEKDENELHKSRLLNVEVKPFGRVTKHLITLHTAATTKARQAPTPPPETNGQNGGDPKPSPNEPDLVQLKEDIELDFAAFNSNIARLQFLLNANEKQRADYASKRGRILAESQAVRDKTAQLRTQLDEARATLEQRKKFDELADKITSNKSLRTRTEQTTNLKKLQEEIAELEDESEKYAITWRERREQFSKIMDESMRLRRLIHDEKEEVERREGMDDEGGAGDGEVEGSQTPRPGLASGNATPRPESGLLPKSSLENGEIAGTPRPVSTTGGQTPARESTPSGDSQLLAKPRPDSHVLGSRSGSQVPLSREPTPNRSADEDIEMGETKETEDNGASSVSPPPAMDTPQIVIDSQDGDDKMDTT
ncbi:hypothetical protein GQ53DRAFT_367182 [Thozetella sp. PMI_491]|nr:hypothetical protein GQ53DRAFT_367182 [Thozetella sp. PMI_491]